LPLRLRKIVDRLVLLMSGDNRDYAPVAPIELKSRERNKVEKLR